MYEMFEILLFIPFILGISYIMKRFIYSRNLGPFKPILNALRFLGVIIHELSHYFVCFITGATPKSISVKLTHHGKVNPSGSVSLKEPEKENFMQAFLGSMAPVIVGAWLFGWSLSVALSETFQPFERIIAGFFCISLLLGATPSLADFGFLPRAFKKDVAFSCYQIFLVLLSGLVVWLLIIYYEIVLLLDLIYYILIGLMYVVLRYSFKGANYIVLNTHFSKRFNSGPKNLGKKRMKSKKPNKNPLSWSKWK